MLVVMERSAGSDAISEVCREVERLGLKAHTISGGDSTTIEVTGNGAHIDVGALKTYPGVLDVVRMSRPYRLVSREYSPGDTVVSVDRLSIGGRRLVIMAGPCAAESREQCLRIAERVAKSGAQVFRGGAYKPRTSPYSFQGLAEKGLKILEEVRQRFGLLVVTEAMDTETIDLVATVADIIQIGSRNMQNFSLLRRAGRVNKPILLKRGMSATLEEFLMAAEYVMAEGNRNVILCERGVRTFADHTRNTLDLSIVPAVKQISHLPIIVDPSHGTGISGQVLPMSRAAVAAGADGLLIEVHDDPTGARSDGGQSIRPAAFDRLARDVAAVARVVGRSL